MTEANPEAPRGGVVRTLTLELARVTERAAIAAARLRGQGNEKEADQAAVDAMRRELNLLPVDGTVVIGEGERDEAPMLYIGERIGRGGGAEVDLAVDPLEGTTLCAKDMPGAISVMAMAERGSLLAAPDVYMQKIAIGPGYPPGLVDLDASPADNIAALARAKGVHPAQITAIILDRPRHMNLVSAVRATGAGIRLISDGDIAGIIFTTSPDETGADIYLGTGAAPEGVIAAGALRCIGGQMQGRLILDSADKRDRAARMGISDPNRKYELTDLARGDVIVAATGVTDGALLKGVRFKPGLIQTETVVYRSSTGTVRRILGEHRAERFEA
ncbi:fructose-1,6-bisphosphatase II / sedoheptulose-1,7-bisphosphatase [Methylobacterium sp. BE186]|uniref:class II fructose-bisphosphatase n=1 Tax=Methylobacterium sp. BE186 TaxID=2817715 RepID=UPI002856DC08|nr:class II fructose-bisphosphatase [Methylobacterium sp. BE186]MDR7037008.1 fructose-1,6-bisphosphatase II / sedoheptulose-1,7-bisphosphatase [Methylobacterium sp. BE186]